MEIHETNVKNPPNIYKKNDPRSMKMHPWIVFGAKSRPSRLQEGGGGPPRGTPGGTPGGPRHHLNPRMGGQRGEPDTISQPVDPGGVGGFCKAS